SPWYLAINPAMTVPSLTTDNQTWTDSRSILDESALIADQQWCDSDSGLAPKIKSIVDAHYAISIEHLTFGKAMTRFAPLRTVFPHILRRIIRKLESSLSSSDNPQALQNKIALNQQRLAFFTEGDLSKK